MDRASCSGLLWLCLCACPRPYLNPRDIGKEKVDKNLGKLEGAFVKKHLGAVLAGDKRIIESPCMLQSRSGAVPDFKTPVGDVVLVSGT